MDNQTHFRYACRLYVGFTYHVSHHVSHIMGRIEICRQTSFFCFFSSSTPRLARSCSDRSPTVSRSSTYICTSRPIKVIVKVISTICIFHIRGKQININNEWMYDVLKLVCGGLPYHDKRSNKERGHGPERLSGGKMRTHSAPRLRRPALPSIHKLVYRSIN